MFMARCLDGKCNAHFKNTNNIFTTKILESLFPAYLRIWYKKSSTPSKFGSSAIYILFFFEKIYLEIKKTGSSARNHKVVRSSLAAADWAAFLAVWVSCSSPSSSDSKTKDGGYTGNTFCPSIRLSISLGL